MQIKKRLQLNIVVSVITAFLVILVLVQAVRDVKRAMDAVLVAGDLERSAFESSALREDYLRTDTGQARRQWLASHERIGRLLLSAEKKFKDADDRQILEKMTRDQEESGKLFAHIVGQRQNVRQDKASGADSRATENHFLNQLMWAVNDTAFNARQLQESGNERLVYSLKAAGTSIVSVILLIAATVIINSWLMSRLIDGRVAKLLRGVSEIGEGSFDYRIDIKGDDEFATLADAFNEMTRKLLQASRDLEKKIGECKRAEEAARESENKLRLFIEHAPAAIAMFDNDMKYLSASRRWFDAYRVYDQEIIGRSHYEVFPDIPERWKEVHRRCLAGAVERHDADPWVRADGTTDWVRWEIRPWYRNTTEIGGVIIFSVIVSDLIRVEQSLRESEERFRVAQELSPDGFTILRPVRGESGKVEDFTWIYENATIARLNGTHPASVVGRRLSDLIPCHEKSPFHEVYRLVAESGKPAVLEAPFYGEPTAEEKWYRVAVVPAGQDIAILSQDITERKEAEARINASLREKDVLLKEIHHRVKNNMQIISSLVSLQADGIKDETFREALQEVNNRVHSMALVHEYLYRSSNLDRIDFSDYVRNLVEYIWLSHGQVAFSIRLKFDLQPVSLPIDIAVPCGLILNELAGNALKHAFKNRSEGEVTVSLTSADSGEITLSVSDDGVGLPAGYDWQQEQTLGLTLVQMLTRQINASVEMNSGVGTRFKVVFTPPSQGRA